jgi:hypothetical protein
VSNLLELLDAHGRPGVTEAEFKTLFVKCECTSAVGIARSPAMRSLAQILSDNNILVTFQDRSSFAMGSQQNNVHPFHNNCYLLVSLGAAFTLRTHMKSEGPARYDVSTATFQEQLHELVL